MLELDTNKTLTLDVSSRHNVTLDLTANRDMALNLSVPRAVGGTRDYEKLKNKPQIESVELIGNKTFPELGISPIDADDLIEILQ